MSSNSDELLLLVVTSSSPVSSYVNACTASASHQTYTCIAHANDGCQLEKRLITNIENTLRNLEHAKNAGISAYNMNDCSLSLVRTVSEIFARV